MKANAKHSIPLEAESRACHVCGAPVEISQFSVDATYWLCDAHGRVLNDSPRETYRLRAVREELARNQVESGVDIETGTRFFRRILQSPPRPQAVSYDDNGSPRFLSTSSPHGQTVRQDVDRIFGGSDPRLDQYREVDNDDGVE